MTGPVFGPGQVVLYEYLWARESKSGQAHGRKERPCAVVISTTDWDGEGRVYLAPVTHSPPARPEDGLEIPAAVKRRLGLDDAASWLVVTELNTTLIPAPEFRKTPDRQWAYGYLPRGLLTRAVKAVRANAAGNRLAIIDRDA